VERTEALAIVRAREAAERADDYAAEAYRYVEDEGRTYIVIPPPGTDVATVAQPAPALDVERTVYTSEHRPPDIKSRDRFHRLVKACPGAIKTGRQWRVSADAWRAYRGSKGASAVIDAGAVARMVAKLRAA
jgi:hypothetical protein